MNKFRFRAALPGGRLKFLLATESSGCHSFGVKLLIRILVLFFLLTSCATPELHPPENSGITEAVVSEPREEERKEEVPVEQKAVSETPTETVEPTPEPAPAPAPAPKKEPAVREVKIVQESAPAVFPASPSALYAHRLQTYPAEETEREVTFRIFPREYLIQTADGDTLLEIKAVSSEKDRAVYSLRAGAVLISAQGYIPQIISLSKHDSLIEAKLERRSGPLIRVGEISTDYQPKSVRFAPDGKSLFIANLGDFTALSQFSLNPLSQIRSFQVPQEYRGDSGFVETLILPGREEIWLSQMTRNIIHIFDMNTGEYLEGIVVSGIWPKVLLATEDGSRVYVSCWDSETIVEIDTESRHEIRSFKSSGTPRGMAFSPDGKNLLAAIFSSSGIDKIDLETGELLATYEASPGRITAMRHIVYDRYRREYYITAMAAGQVYRLSEDGKWLGWWEVGEKPNTCAVSPDGSRLFVSCRGPNNPDTGYLHKGYEFGKIFVINLISGEVESWIWGQDQPTGLDISPDGQYLAFSDFLSHKLELYRITRSSQPVARGGQ